MSIVPVVVGSAVNDGTGDPIRTAFQKINTSISELGARVYDTRAAAIAATIGAGVNAIRTAGFAAVGDGGEALYKRRGSAPTLTTSKAYINSADGAWWELVPHGGRDVFIEQFGGKADWTGTPGTSTDNYAPIVDALTFISYSVTAVEVFPYRINFRAGAHWFSAMVDIHVHAWIRGMTMEEAGDGGTRFYFPSTTTCFLLSQNNTVGESSSGSGLSNGQTILEDFSIHHYYATGAFDHAVYSPKHAIHARSCPVIRNVYVYRIAGHGMLIHGNSGGLGALEGAPNQWHVRDSGVHSCGGHALCIYGADANAGSAIGFSTHTEVGGCGIYDNSPYSNYYAGIHLAGYGNRGVSRDGRRYVLLSGSPIENPSTIPQTTTPGTNPDVWFDVGPDDASRPDIWPAWSSSNTYPLYRLPIYDAGGASLYDGVYVEISNAPAHVLPGSLVLGGTIGCTPQSSMSQPNADGVLLNRRGVGADRLFQAGSLGPQGVEYTRNGSQTSVFMGTSHLTQGYGVNGGMQFISHRRFSDASAGLWQWGYQGNDMAYTAPNNASIWEVTSQSTTRQHGRGVADPYRLRLFNPVFQGDDANQFGSITFGANRPVSLPHAAGEIVFEPAPVNKGVAGYMCVTAGTPGTWRQIPIFGLTSVVPQDNGDLVVECTSNTSLTFKYRGSDGTVRSAVLALT